MSLWPILEPANKICFHNIVFSNKTWNLQGVQLTTCKFEARNSSSIQTRSSSMELGTSPLPSQNQSQKTCPRASLESQPRREARIRVEKLPSTVPRARSWFTVHIASSHGWHTKTHDYGIERAVPWSDFLWVSWCLHHLPKETVCETIVHPQH